MSDGKASVPWACPSCGSIMQARPGRLACPGCPAEAPFLGGLPCFDGADGRGPAREDYERFLLAKGRRPARDAYAAFQPFNESSRTWMAFRKLIAGMLRPGDIILDLHARTGWTGEVLARAFPDQQVVSLWEGDTDVLGHRGFAYWFGDGRAAANLSIAFLAPGRPLPLPAGSVRLVHGYDVLHHRDHRALLRECLRVGTADAAFIFPHVHTGDGEPDPWFLRDGELRTAAAYRDDLAPLLAGSGRRCAVLGEAGLFTAQGGDAPLPRLVDASGDGDYNALVAVVPEPWIGAELALEDAASVDPAAAVLANPLVRVDPVDGTVRIDEREEGIAAHLLLRHPVYARRLRARLPERLDPQERLVHYWADRLPDAAAIGARLGLPASELAAILIRLRRAEVVALQPLGAESLRLQRLHASGVDLPGVEADHPVGLWRRAVACFPDRPWLAVDGEPSALTYADADAVIRAAARRLARQGVGPGARVVLAAGLGMEALLLAWGAMLRGATVAVCDPTWPEPIAVAAAAEIAPAVVFARGAPWTIAGAALVCPDPGGAAPPAGWTPFAEWLEDADFAGEDPAVASVDPLGAGAILFTTGSTGRPKGVLLAWAALARSARLMAGHYRWSEHDRLVSLGGLHTMSGLRNPCLAAVAAGAAVVLPAADGMDSALAVAELIRRHGATLLGAAPATLQGLIGAADRIGDGLATLRAVLCTGSRLPDDLRLRFEARFAAPVRNYYGLTETCGFCFGDPPEGEAGPENIGLPVDAIVRVVDHDGNDVARGASGELWIHSANLLIGYLGRPPRPAADPWYRTGDEVRFDGVGRCILVARLRDIVKNSHGEIVACREIEDALLSMPGLADAAVIPARDRSGLERACAYVVPHAPPADPEAWLADLRGALLRRLGAKRMPGLIIIRTEIPRSSNGKLRRDQLDSAQGTA